MKFKISQLIFRLKAIIPGPVKSVLRALGLGRWRSIFRNSATLEMEYQQSLVEVVRDHQSELLEYWRKYRYLDDIIVMCKINANTRVLDVGCGISTVLHFLEGERYGIDPLAGEYKRLYSFPEGIDIRRGRGENIPFPDACFDILISSSALDHVSDPSKTVAETRRVLRPGGYLVLYVDVYKENEVSGHSRYSLEKKDVYSLLGDKFRTILERESPRIPLRAYVNGSRESCNQELLMILKKV
jgi:SAM-dependent methyltransferase